MPARPNLILGICCMSLLLVGMDVTIVNVALPSIQHDLRAPLSDLQWVMDAYTIVIASLLMLAGSMADRFGRRRTFQLGMVLFSLGSLLCSVASSIEVLIISRALQGIGASMLNPVALSIITNTFIEPKARARAIGVWGAVAGISMAVGPLIGGVLTQTLGWRYVFLINLPISVAAVILTARFVPESKAARARALDPIGQLLVFIALACLMSAIIEGPRIGWTSGLAVSLFAATAASVAALLIYEPRLAEPLLDLHFFRSVPFSSATLIAICAFAAFSGFLFLNTLYLQQVRGLSAFETGLCTLPMALMAMLCGPFSGHLVGHHGTRPSLLIAGTGFLVSALMLTNLDGNSAMSMLLLAYAIFGIGLGTVNPAIANTAVSGMPKSQAGVAAAIASTSRQIGAALGVAIAGTVVNSSRASGMAFTRATHPIWWLAAGCGAIIILLGFVTHTAWARASTHRVEASLLRAEG
ncbi:MFS transporter [Dyella jejuensis]|uniref:MFS transporter n=2 Tax=Dyella jejuensis TaxID=1432009 RepID=A0ABW8JIN5_9GAMM